MEMVDPMKSDDLLDYSLGLLEGSPLATFEADLARDPDLADRARRLDRSLRDLLDDGEPFEPPAGLAGRTLAFVAERQDQRAVLEFAPRRPRFRWADLAVAAGILAAGTLTLLPAVKAGREQMKQASCAHNLQRLGTSLANYAVNHRHYPKVVDEQAIMPVGFYASALAGDRLLPDAKALHCPCKGDCPAEELQTDPRHMDFAYNIGYVDPETKQAKPITPWLGAPVPLLADQPAYDAAGNVLAGNSPNHSRRGQNVLFSDLSLRWLPTRQVSPQDGDLFLNQRHQPQPGVSPHDSAVMPAPFHIPPVH